MDKTAIALEIETLPTRELQKFVQHTNDSIDAGVTPGRGHLTRMREVKRVLGERTTVTRKRVK